MSAISPAEHRLISAYAAAELAGALIIGRVARKTKDPDLRVKLTRHCAEEARHAWRWTEALLSLGAEPLEVHDEPQERYFARAKGIGSEIELLAFMLTFETLATFHLTMHQQRPGTHPVIRRVIEELNADEAGHTAWTKERLDAYRRQGRGAEVDTARSKFTAWLKADYQREIAAMRQAGGELAEFAELIERHLPAWLR